MTSFYGGVGITGSSVGGSGVSISKIEIDDSRNFIIYLSNGTKTNLGVIDGATFTPSISDEGILSWSNTQGLVNPPDYNLLDKIAAENQGEQWYPVGENTSEDLVPTTEYLWEKI